MASVTDIWFKYVERPLDSVGLLQSPVKRFGAFSAATMGILYLTKPKTLFDAQGKPFPSSLMSTETYSIPMDWVTTSLFVGVLSVLFI